MNITLLQGASGPNINGPTVRIPLGNYRIEKSGSHNNCMMYINDAPPIEINSKIILSNNSSVRLTAKDAKDLTVRFIKED